MSQVSEHLTPQIYWEDSWRRKNPGIWAELGWVPYGVRIERPRFSPYLYAIGELS